MPAPSSRMGLIASTCSGGAAGFADKILKGAKPGDRPFEQAARFDLVLNLKTVKALGVAIPHSFRLRADRVIE